MVKEPDTPDKKQDRESENIPHDPKIPPETNLEREDKPKPTIITSYEFSELPIDRGYLRQITNANGPNNELGEDDRNDNKKYHENLAKQHCDSSIIGAEKKAQTGETELKRAETRLEKARDEFANEEETKKEKIEGQQHIVPWTTQANILKWFLSGALVICLFGSGWTFFRTLVSSTLEFAGQEISAVFVAMVFILISAGLVVGHEKILKTERDKIIMSIATLVPGLAFFGLFIFALFVGANDTQDLSAALGSMTLLPLEETSSFDLLDYPFLWMVMGEILISATCAMFLLELFAKYGVGPKFKEVKNQKFFDLKTEVSDLEKACDDYRSAINLRDQLRARKEIFVENYVLVADSSLREMHAEHVRYHQNRSR